MATKKTGSQAEKAAADAKKKNTSTKSKSSGQTKAKPKVANKDFSHVFPPNVVIAFVSLALFVLCLSIAINPDGWLLKFLESVFQGLIGEVGFYFSIPALLYIFVVYTFGRKTKTTMRAVCVLAFVLLSGAIAHLSLEDGYLAFDINTVANLFKGGAAGTTGGVICGGLAMFVRWGCGKTISYILFFVGAVLTLLGSMQITVFSLFQAIQNRPRDEQEELAKEEVDPATVVVNHIANKRIAHNRSKRQQMEVARHPILIEETHVPDGGRQESLSAPQKKKPVKVSNPRADDMMSQIETEIGAPVAAAAEHVVDNTSADVTTSRRVVVPVEEPENIPVTMPELLFADQTVDTPKQRKRATVQEEPQVEKTEKVEKISAKDAAASAKQVAAEIAMGENTIKNTYCFPPVDLLNRPSRGSADGTEEMRENSRRLNETLASFNIDAHITNVTRGPSVTRYEVELDKGVRLNKLTSCADDIALSLGASGVRIAAVPGKISIVGIEVPNRTVTNVSLREVIDSPEFTRAKSKSSIALGKSIDGNCVVGNIAKMPHLLIAGTTGSGKSVCMNSIILSLLYKAGPDDVKLIMVDPKMVELGIYNGIPHLLIPVVTDPKKAAGSLQWAVTEMLRRYQSMSELGVRDLESYNSIVTAEENGLKLPQIVVIIDELADLMMVAAKEVEDSICRIAQMGRAAGMHLIIATQRPSANVITGLMKANIPSRIAFSVASAMESRIILDTMGAEKLVGKGDMLYAPIGAGKPLRVQGCFVTDTEVESVASYVKENSSADYNQEVLKDIEKNAQQAGKKAAGALELEPSEDELGGDELLPAAVDVILDTGQASVSMLQRRLKLGYARAARIVDEMEEKGIVGPFQGSKPRAILVTKEQWASMRSGAGQQMGFDDLNDYGVPEELN